MVVVEEGSDTFILLADLKDVLLLRKAVGIVDWLHGSMVRARSDDSIKIWSF